MTFSPASPATKEKFESDLNSGLATRKEMSYSDFFEDCDGQASIFNQNKKSISFYLGIRLQHLPKYRFISFIIFIY